MKKYLILFCAALILTGGDSIKAQSISFEKEKDTTFMQEDTVAVLKSFAGAYNSGSVYLKWIASNQHADGVYIVLRSSDNIAFEPIGYKKGIGVPISNDISYYFADNSPLSGTIHYKVIHMGKNKTFLSTDIIAVNSKQKEAIPDTKASHKNKNEAINEKNTP